MEQSEMRKMLELVKEGTISPEEAMLRIREAPYTDLGYARIDNHRQVRQGFAEVIYGEGKSKDQILGIAQKMMESGVKRLSISGKDSAFPGKAPIFSIMRFQDSGS